MLKKTAITTLLALISACASMEPQVMADLKFAADNVSNLDDPRITPVKIAGTSLPAEYKENQKFAICNMNFELEKDGFIYAPRSVEISKCSTNDETGFLERQCKLIYPGWGFSPKSKLSEGARFEAVCALRAAL